MLLLSPMLSQYVTKHRAACHVTGSRRPSCSKGLSQQSANTQGQSHPGDHRHIRETAQDQQIHQVQTANPQSHKLNEWWLFQAIMFWGVCHAAIYNLYCIYGGFPGGSVVKNPPAKAGEASSIPGSGRSPGEGNGNPLQYSCLGNPMDGGAWQGYSPWGHEKQSDTTQRLNNNSIWQKKDTMSKK